jgi:hypothetical protein
MADKAIQPDQTKRYLPEKAWASLSKEERAKTINLDTRRKRSSRKLQIVSLRRR